MVNRAKFVSEFRKKFRKRFFIDLTGVFNVVVLMVSSVVFLPLVAVYFNISIFHFFIILQIANMVFNLWIWHEVRNMRKEL